MSALKFKNLYCRSFGRCYHELTGMSKICLQGASACDLAFERRLIYSVKCSTFSKSRRNTIFALSSGGGKCGVMVFRVSGPQVREVIQTVTKCVDSAEPRKAHLRKFYHPLTGEKIDQGFLLWFPGPKSFTGEDCCELHVHGSLAVASAVIDALGSMPGLRLAEPGEFTRRSFQNGKLDLTEVEGLADLIDAETEAQRRQALRQMDGALSRLYSTWKDKLLKCVAHLEAFIDFGEEESIEDGIAESVLSGVILVQNEIECHLADNRCGERVRSGVRLAIIGEPNVGKSSLLNSLCHRPAAIVSPIAGTTRDVVETALNVAGYPVVVSDTAGLRETSDEVEVEGVRRAIKRSKEADLIVLVVDCTQFLKKEAGLNGQLTIDQFVADHLSGLGVRDSVPPSVGMSSCRIAVPDLPTGTMQEAEVLLVLNKQDLLPPQMEKSLLASLQSHASSTGWCLASCCSKDGLNDFLNILKEKLKNLCSSASAADSPVLTNDRHRQNLISCLRFLTAYVEKHSTDSVLGAEDLRRAVHQIGKITGRVTSEDVLDVIFRDFCIGK